MNARSRLAVWLFTALAGVVIPAVALAIAGRLTIEQLSLRLEDVKVDPGRLLRGDASAITRVGRGEGEVTLAQEDVQTFLASAKGVRRAGLRLGAGGVTVEGDVGVG